MQEEFEPINQHEREPYPSEDRQRAILERLRAKVKTNRQLPSPSSVPRNLSDSDSETEPSKANKSEANRVIPARSLSGTNGWNQGDGRRADNLVLYEQRIPESIRRRIVSVKGTHFRFRNLSDETAFLEAIVGSEPYRAVYQPTGKRDVILTGSNGELIGHVHLLHVNAPDIHHPEKYYVKFYLFDFADASSLQAVKQNILSFFQTWGTSPASRSRVDPAFRSRVAALKTRRRPFRSHRFRPRHRGSKMKIEGTSKRTRKVFRRR